MKLKVIGSSSAGNGYLIYNKEHALLIEAGVKFSEVKKALNFKVGMLVGVLVSHSHNDHAGCAHEYLREGVKVYASEDTLFAIKASHHNAIPFKSNISFWAGPFHVLAFPVVHDVPCHGFLINNTETGRFVFITDTHYSPARFNGLNNILIESNYSEAILDKRMERGEIQQAYHDRVLRSHMSFETAMGFLAANDLSAVNNIVLLHLSGGNSDAKGFGLHASKQTGKTVHVADKGMEIDFNKYPF